MRIDFTEEDKAEELNKIELEGEDVILIGEYIETVENEENTYIISGDAVVEGELYHDFVTIFALFDEPEEMSARAIARAEWDWFDYVCDWNSIKCWIIKNVQSYVQQKYTEKYVYIFRLIQGGFEEVLKNYIKYKIINLINLNNHNK